PGVLAALVSLLPALPLHVARSLMPPAPPWLPPRLHQLHRPLRRLGHRILQPPVGVGGVAEDLGPLGAELEDLHHQRVVVVLPRVITTLDVMAPDLLPEIAPLGVAEERLHRRAGIGDQPLAL